MIILKDGKRFLGAPHLDPEKIIIAVKSGAWGDAELAEYGLVRAKGFFRAPEGKVAVGEPRYEQQEDGTWAETYELVDAPPPPPPPTTGEKIDRMLAAYGLTLDELKAAL